MVRSSPLSEADIRECVIRAQNGDTGAFERLYDHFFDVIFRYSAIRLPPEIAEDVTADIFVKAWEKLHTYKPQKSVPFAAWLFRIARHTVIDGYRRQKKHEEIPDTLADYDRLNHTETRLKQGESIQLVRSALEKLPGRYREVLMLSYFGELPHEEIARVLRLSTGGVRILKMRALRKLEALLPADELL